MAKMMHKRQLLDVYRKLDVAHYAIESVEEFRARGGEVERVPKCETRTALAKLKEQFSRTANTRKVAPVKVDG